MDKVVEPVTCQFGDFILDFRVRGLFRLDDGRAWLPVPLGSRAIDILCLLVERRGELVSRTEIMDLVWPGVAVEEQNLTVQISTLRRVLDDGRDGASFVQTIPSRGYRFLPEPIELAPSRATGIGPPDPPPEYDAGNGITSSEPRLPPSVRADGGDGSPVVRRPWLIRSGWILASVCVIALLGSLAWYTRPRIEHPRVSLVVLPFQNLSGNPAEDYLADGITDDLTSDVSRIPEAFVIARESAYTYKGKPTDVRQIGQELGVRYVLEGSVRKFGNTLRVNVQLISAETGLHLWSDRFDEDIKDLADGQERVVARMSSELGINMIEVESKRGQRERPTNPDAFDLILQARALRNLPLTPQRRADALGLFERALLLDPGSTLAMANIASLLLQPRAQVWYWSDFETMARAQTLMTQALTIAPRSQVVLRVHLSLLRVQERWKDATVEAQRFIEMFPNDPGGYVALGFCKTFTGNAEEGIELAKQAIHINPRAPYVFGLYFDIGYASLMLGRDADAITSFERSLALNPEIGAFGRQKSIRKMAAAYARMGEDDQAHRALAEANRLFPFDTVRGHWPEDPTSTIYAQQVRNYQDGLRLAGLRDHADENADFGVPPDAELHQDFAGLTPTTVPGARTIRTGDLVALLAERKPLVIDLLSYFWGKSIPGAVGLKEAGAGGSLSGPGHDRLHRKIAELTGGDLSRPIVAVGWNSERFDGRNLALRLVAMGYTDVYWYRGGREAWEVNGLPENELTATDW